MREQTNTVAAICVAGEWTIARYKPIRVSRR